MADPLYYYRVGPGPRLATWYVRLLNLVVLYERLGETVNAARVEAALGILSAGYEDLAKRGPVKADAMIRSRLRTTQKRPETPGPHLRDAIQSRPLPTRFPVGAIGIATIAELEAHENPRTGGSYWRAQEYGLPVRPQDPPVGGYFQGADPENAAPSQDQFRVHPYFQAQRGRGMPALVRRRPLAARRFLERGTEDYLAWHASRAASIEENVAKALNRTR